MGFRLGTLAALGAAVVLVTSCSSDDGSPEPAGSQDSSAPDSTAPGGTDEGADEGGTYLALGDSVPFGFRPGATAEYPDAENFVGYPQLVAEELGLEVLNAACPGETTESFLDTSAQSLGCHNSPASSTGYRTAYPLHVPYTSAEESQLDLAIRTLQETDDVELVTLQIGANDAFLCRLTTASRCADPADTGALADTLQRNLDTILSALRDDGGYDGQVVVVTYYALDYSDAGAGALAAGITRIAEANGADVADGFAAFRDRAQAAGGSSVAAGLVIPQDVHPSDEGHRLLADAVLAVADVA